MDLKINGVTKKWGADSMLPTCCVGGNDKRLSDLGGGIEIPQKKIWGSTLPTTIISLRANTN
jgi:hypothetical protein